MLISAVRASTTHIDRHNERMAKSALDGMAEQIRSRFVPYLMEHDPERQIGVVLCGRVARLNDGEYGLYIVVGLFENEEEKQKYQIGSINTVWKEYSYRLDNVDTKAGDFSFRSPHPDSVHKDGFNIAELLEIHLDSTKIWTDGSVYKVKHFIAATRDLQIHVYPKDHYPAHFHVISKQRNIDARFDLNTLEPISEKRGTFSNSDIKKIKNFLDQNPKILGNLRSEHARMQ